MTNPTSNFNWIMPEPTSLVTDLPADFEVFGQAVDTDLADLLGGTTGQVLSKTSATDLAFTWVDANPGDITGVTAGTGISGGGTTGTVTVTNSMATAITTAGDLIKGTGSGTFDRLGIGSTGQVLTVASGAPSWETPATPASGLTKIVSTTFSSVSSQAFENCFTSTYRSYIIQMSMIWGSSRSQLQAQFYRLTNTLLIDYSGGVMKIPTTGTPTTGYAHSYATVFTIGQMPDQSGGQRCGGQIVINSAEELDSGGYGTFSANSVTQSGGGISDRNGFIGALNIDGNNSCTGFVLSPSTGTFNGTVTVYGLEK
jgi:hypothetical protein